MARSRSRLFDARTFVGPPRPSALDALGGLTRPLRRGEYAAFGTVPAGQEGAGAMINVVSNLPELEGASKIRPGVRFEGTQPGLYALPGSISPPQAGVMARERLDLYRYRKGAMGGKERNLYAAELAKAYEKAKAGLALTNLERQQAQEHQRNLEKLRTREAAKAWGTIAVNREKRGFESAEAQKERDARINEIQARAKANFDLRMEELRRTGADVSSPQHQQLQVEALEQVAREAQAEGEREMELEAWRMANEARKIAETTTVRGPVDETGGYTDTETTRITYSGDANANGIADDDEQAFQALYDLQQSTKPEDQQTAERVRAALRKSYGESVITATLRAIEKQRRTSNAGTATV